MRKRDPRIDMYIAKSADFARPILEHIRSLVHKACPDVQDTREKRVATTVAWVAEGKGRNRKYEKKNA